MENPQHPIEQPNVPKIAALPEAPLKGTSARAAGVTGQSNNSYGVYGQCIGPVGDELANQETADGVYGEGKNGVHGVTSSGQTNAQGFGNSGVLGQNYNQGQDGGNGVSGVSSVGHGVYGQTSGDGSSNPGTVSNFSGVCGVHLSNGPGVLGVSMGNGAGIVAVGQKGIGLIAEGGAGQLAARFQGNVAVDGDVTLSGADCAEQFNSAEDQQLEPGTVVVIGRDGALRESRESYDKKVAGVISGAGPLRPAIVMNGYPSQVGRALVAMVGKVYCKVDADYAPIDVGDLLTASSTPGHAMKASDPTRAFGSVIGKALGQLPNGRGLVPVLVALQ